MARQLSKDEEFFRNNSSGRTNVYQAHGPAHQEPLTRCQQMTQDCRKDFYHFKVLMWKHWVVRKKKIFYTLGEVITPCVLFVAMYFLLPTMEEKAAKKEKETALTLDEYSGPLEGISGPRILMYHPVNKFTDELMNKVGKKLHLKRTRSIPAGQKYSMVYYGCPDNLKPLVNYLAKWTDGSAIVEFQGTGKYNAWLAKLNYTIKMTHKIEYNEGPEEVEDYSSFMRIQWAVDSSYIQMKYKNSNKPGLRSSRHLPPVALSEVPDKQQKEIINRIRFTVICHGLMYVCAVSLLLPFLSFCVKLIEERGSGVQELVKQVGVSYTVMVNAHGCNTIPVGLMYSIVGVVVITVAKWLPRTNMFLMFLALELHFHSVLTYAFLVSFVTKDGNNAYMIASTFYLVTAIVLQYIAGVPMERYFLVPLGFLPHVPMLWFLEEVRILETKGRGLGFSDVLKSHTKYSLSVLETYLTMAIQIVFILNISQYLNEVRPGQYGVKRPWLYIFKRKETVSPIALEEIEAEKLQRDPKFFESTKLTNVGIHIENVSKIFNMNVALSKVNFDVYQGEITVLLGHNGAGKTTLLSIIASSLLPTTGRIKVHGYDIAAYRSKVQQMIGTCTQHNLFFPDLTVKEHVMLFAMLRGASFAAAKDSSLILLEKLGLKAKVDFKGSELSGGMKRRLQLGCALAGDCIVLILDEPTSGLDVETRRELWSLLLSLRGDRTVLLTTHFMEEADALGDRVVAMHSGRVRCHATPMYLKKVIGTGYRLTLTTIESLPQEKAITATIQDVIPNATVKEVTLHSVSYNLPSQDSSYYPDMFMALEANKSKLGIESIGVGATSLEEVFMRWLVTVPCTDVFLPQDMTPIGTFLDSTVMRDDYAVTQIQNLQQITLILNYLSILVPTLMYVGASFVMVNMQKKSSAPPPSPSAFNLDFKDLSDMMESAMLLSTAPDLKETAKRFARSDNLTFKFTDNIPYELFRASEQNKNYSKYNLGIELHDILAKVFYTTAYREAAPVALNLLSNILAHNKSDDDDTDWSITTNYELMQYDEAPQSAQLPVIKNPADISTSFLAVIIMTYFLVNALVNAVGLPTKEREAGTRHIHLMAGVPPTVHWLTTWLCHLLTYAVVLFPMALIFCFFDITSTFNEPAFMGTLALVYLLVSMASLPLFYLATFSRTKEETEMDFMGLNIVCGGYLAYVYMLVKDSKLYSVAKFFFYTFPLTTANIAACKAANVVRLNAMCDKNLNLCPDTLVTIFNLPANGTQGFDAKKCCSEKKGTACYLCIGDIGIGRELLIMAAQTVAYFTLVIMAQDGYFTSLSDKLFNRGYSPGDDASTERNVVKERNYVSQRMALQPEIRDQGPDILLVNDIHKRYSAMNCFSCNKFTAVKGISFSMKKGECFGLLGVNGAGKSTTFKMISAETKATMGSIYVNKILLKWPRSSAYLQSLSYCPQFFGLDTFETGYNNLMTLLVMRGLNSADARKEADSWIEVVGLGRYRDKKVESYSGGCERRLATAAALSSGAPLTLLDEPTAGVDVSARRKVWVALKKGLRQNRSVMITSHSMDEMEALCDRIVIMADAKIAALGSAPALRANYATGHSLHIKVTGAHREDVEKLKNILTNTFNCTLVDERPSMLQYHINEQMPYSEIFATLENLKTSFQPEIIEDYSVSETTLEEVFLSFAKKPEAET